MISLEPQLQETLTFKQRSTVEAILARSQAESLSARCLETALSLLHVRADGATAYLLSVLERAVVYVLLTDPDDWKTVLILDNDAHDSYIGVFTSEAQAEIARQDYGKAYQPTAIDVVLLCRSLEGVLGLAINPHDDVLAFEITPEIFEHFRRAIRTKGKPEPDRYYSVLASDSGYHLARVDAVGQTSITLTWIETSYAMRPATLEPSSTEGYPHEACEASPKAFQRWLPLRIEEADL